MKKTLSLQAGMGADIIRHLRQFGDLPERGVVAGQAVASSILDLYAGGGGVYNDVDIFRRVTCKDVALKAGRATKTVGLTTVGAQGDRDDYSGLSSFLAMVRSYQVSSVSRDGLLNYVNCSLPKHFGRDLSPARVIQSFDLNCVRAAVDLETNILVWDRHFEHFLHSRQLEIATVHTPWHTFLRLLKKLEELPNVYADVATSAEVVAAIAQSKYYADLLYKGSVSDSFGAKNLQMAERLRASWEPYFTLSTKMVEAGETQIALSSLVPNGQVDSAIMARVDALKGGVLHGGAGAVYSAHRKTSAMTRAKVDQVAAVTSALDIRRILHLQGERYVQGQVTDKHIEVVQGFFNQHMVIEHTFSDMTLDEQFHAVKRLEALARERGDWVFGAIETRACANDVANAAALELLLTRYQKEQQAPLKVKPLDLPVLPRSWVAKGWSVEELLTVGALQEEGTVMGHCVGGYASRVRSNSCRILRIRTGGDKAAWSTAELRPSGYSDTIVQGKPLAVQQHRARFNQAPSPDNEKVLRYVMLSVGAPWWQKLAVRTGLEPVLGRLQSKTARWLDGLVTGAEALTRRLRASVDRMEEMGELLQQDKTSPQ
jgi:hypothetical protein